jgi:hypothetical protein
MNHAAPGTGRITVFSSRVYWWVGHKGRRRAKVILIEPLSEFLVAPEKML